MSKSLGNVIVPSKVMNQFGADIRSSYGLLLWIITADVRVSDANL